MTEAMPGPIPRQLSKKTELATIVEKNAATSSSSNTLEAPVVASTNEASSSKLRTTRPGFKLSEDDNGESSDSDEEKLGTKTPKAKFSTRASDGEDDSEEDEKLDTKTPRPKSPVARSSDSSGEEIGTKTPKAAISLSRPQASHHHKSSHRHKSNELPSGECGKLFEIIHKCSSLFSTFRRGFASASW